MRHAVEETLSSLKIVGASVTVSERGALDCTLRARVETAARRALAAGEGIGDRL
jgi:citrate lyase subunit gamma (acyl carrier protein)